MWLCCFTEVSRSSIVVVGGCSGASEDGVQLLMASELEVACAMMLLADAHNSRARCCAIRPRFLSLKRLGRV